MPRPVPIIIPGTSAMGGQAREVQTTGSLDLGAIMNLYDQFVNKPKRDEANQNAIAAVARYLGLDKAKDLGTATMPQQPGMDVEALKKSPMFQNIVTKMMGNQYLKGANQIELQGMKNKEAETIQAMKNKEAETIQAMKNANKQYTQTQVLKDLSGKTSDYIRYKYNPDTQAYDIPQGFAQPNWATSQQVTPDQMKSYSDALSQNRMSYEDVQKNLSRTVKGQSDFLKYMEQNYPGFNYTQSSANARFVKGQNWQNQVRFIDTLVGDPETGQPGTFDRAIQLKDMVDKEIGSSGVPVIDAQWIRAARLAGGNTASAMYANTLYDVAREKARAAAGTGATVTDAQTNQELDKTYIGYTTDQINDIMKNEKGIVLMRRHALSKGTAFDMGPWDQVENKYFGGPTEFSNTPSMFQKAFEQGDKKLKAQSPTPTKGGGKGYSNMSDDEIRKQLGL